ncbi:protein TRACHEARY ELEMENT DIFFERENTIATION-RELATED 7A [Aricia agestis]|uniref:protein TRACHEARY ELEMENT DIFFERENTIATION-RELATED 7A n=1 Tax=Aricia agestis TaxID=91739 RepID=UPI001C20A6FE|nr:protein TRACHEARY ELEMENT DIFFERENTIATION-RELATED 7A [Aricia agestis]
MLSLYRAWLGPGPCVARPAPPPGAHRPVPRRARAPSPPPASPASAASSELDVERVETPPAPSGGAPTAVVDVASCDGPVRFSRVLNAAWQEREWCRHRRRPAPHYYPCKTCGSKFPSYYFVHKHRKRCHADEPPAPPEPEPSTSAAP